MSSLGIMIYAVGFVVSALVAFIAYKKHWKIVDWF